MHEHRPQNLRNAAARAFRESLEQLQNILPPEPQTAESDFQSEGELSSHNQTNTQIWEEAAADLDAFFGDPEPSPTGPLDEEIK